MPRHALLCIGINSGHRGIGQGSVVHATFGTALVLQASNAHYETTVPFISDLLGDSILIHTTHLVRKVFEMQKFTEVIAIISSCMNIVLIKHL
jgi:hypothetical protein